MTPEMQARMFAVESAALRPDARLITALSLTFENFLEEVGLPLTPEQVAALEAVRTQVAA